MRTEVQWRAGPIQVEGSSGFPLPPPPPAPADSSPPLPLRYGDCMQSGWANVLDLVTCFYRLQMLPESFAKALNGDGEVSVVAAGNCLEEV